MQHYLHKPKWMIIVFFRLSSRHYPPKVPGFRVDYFLWKIKHKWKFQLQNYFSKNNYNLNLSVNKKNGYVSHLTEIYKHIY